MSKIQGESLKIENETFKIIDGSLCGSLFEILKPAPRQNVLNITVFSTIGPGADDYNTIVQNLTSTFQTTYLDHIKESLTDNKAELIDAVTNSMIDYCKLVDEKIKQAK